MRKLKTLTLSMLAASAIAVSVAPAATAEADLTHSFGPTNVKDNPQLPPDVQEKQKAWATTVLKCAGAAGITYVTGGTGWQSLGACGIATF